ncbi:MAG: hypothetical protein LW809_00910 [Vampirovibrionales bacterium]|jgi:SpoVK/Ycf46/Vps4 family AAA+-type ATPase|nr:hypothetical protein [Vampirovibrionales bacterium]
MKYRFERLKERLNQAEQTHRPLLDLPSTSPTLERIKSRLNSSKTNFTISATSGESISDLAEEEKNETKNQKDARISGIVPHDVLLEAHEAKISAYSDDSIGALPMSPSYNDLSEAPSLEGIQNIDLDDALLDSVYNNDVSDERIAENISTAINFSPLDAEVAQSSYTEVVARKPQLSLNHLAEPKPIYDTEYTNNVRTLITLVNNLPEGVTKQTGAQIIRLTMEAMGIAMEEVLSEAQAAQSEMLEAVRGNIKKIEEYKTVIRKLESDIKHYQGKANELSEIIDLFILSSSSKASDSI